MRYMLQTTDWAFHLLSPSYDMYIDESYSNRKEIWTLRI